MTHHRHTRDAVLHTATGEYSLRVRVADTFLSRLRGLMFAPPLPANEALLLMRCASVHTGFMRCPVDVLYLEASGVVARCVAGLRPWHLSLGGFMAEARGRHTLELAEGSIHRFGVRRGDRLEHGLFRGAPGVRR
ncbi:DUF192 domain-containing protein [Hydrogenophaga sp. SNF1]|uniref:DUF192 domain-containing protein n=1 Tax=Hydrogenophaga borbori TaxID=2294117 RepID=A0A372EIJ5_9BURK|nr:MULTISPECIES: DUF192 domain-containing protein [Hydrogenophaga]RFP78363.1 DUF192 domain-containing protein [Hydrogenophaga borbori]WQB82442.1 DUF192 domain-containing protein [Hydrogenophaga sp. SNF1]